MGPWSYALSAVKSPTALVLTAGNHPIPARRYAPAFSPIYRDTLLRATKDDLPPADHAGHRIALDLELREHRGRGRELQELALDGARDRAREVRTSGDVEVARHVGSGLGQRHVDGYPGRALAGVSRPRADDVGGRSVRHRLLFLDGGAPDRGDADQREKPDRGCSDHRFLHCGVAGPVEGILDPSCPLKLRPGQ